MDFDSLLEDVDEFGTYQRLLLAFVLIPSFVPCGFHAYNQIFMAASPDHWCRIPGLDSNSSLSIEHIKNCSIPLERREDGGLRFSQCTMYDIDINNSQMNDLDTLSINMIKMYDDGGGGNPNLSNLTIVPCKYGWNYDFSTYSSTIVTEWDIVCDYSFYPTLALVLLGSAGIVGTYICGDIQDRLGRRPAFFIFLGLQCFFGVLTGFAVDYWTWLITRIGVGFTVPAITVAPFFLAQELVGPKHRTLSWLLMNIAYSLCLMALAVVAYFVRGWRNLAFSTVLPFVIFFVFWWVLPESPRWTFAHGKLDKTERILRQIAHVNGKTLPDNYRALLEERYASSIASERKKSKVSCGDEEKKGGEKKEEYGYLDLLRGPVLRRNTIIITFIWFVNLGVYVGLSYYAPILGGDEYLNFFLAGLAELPTYLFLFPCLDTWGRRWTLFSSMVIGGVACICTIIIQDEPWVTLTLYCIGKFGISAAFVAIQQIASEIYPTVVRGRGIGLSSTVGMLAPALVPLVNYTGQEYLYLPLLVLGGLMVAGGMSALALPETLGRALPQTLAEAEEFRIDCSLNTCCPKTNVLKDNKKKKDDGGNRNEDSDSDTDRDESRGKPYPDGKTRAEEIQHDKDEDFDQHRKASTSASINASASVRRSMKELERTKRKRSESQQAKKEELVEQENGTFIDPSTQSLLEEERTGTQLDHAVIVHSSLFPAPPTHLSSSS